MKQHCRTAGARFGCHHERYQGELKMDARKFLKGPTFRTTKDVEEGPVQSLIERVEEGKYGKLNLIFADMTAISVNATNNRVLIGAFGYSTENWIGRTVELYAGEVEFAGKPQPAVMIRPLDVPKKPMSAAPPLTDLVNKNDDMGGDDIPF
jgi:hypothetical protein